MFWAGSSVLGEAVEAVAVEVAVEVVVKEVSTGTSSSRDWALRRLSWGSSPA